MKYIILLSLLTGCFSACTDQQNTVAGGKSESHTPPSEAFRLELGQPELRSKFEDDSWSIWGGSIVKGDDGLYHMFYSRWKKQLGWAWVTNSEIAHAVADDPLGPFKFKNVALSIRGKEYWDGLCTHNPTIHKFNGKYYLYYMGNTGDGLITSSPGKAVLNPIHRNNQRIGVAVADNPEGPWERFDAPVIDVGAQGSMDALMVSNPSITKKPEGGYLLIYKAVGKQRPGIWGGPVVHCVATSDNPIGPFIKYDQPVFQVEGYDFPAEDPFVWYQEGKYRAIVKDMHGAFTNKGRSLALFESLDGFSWSLSSNPLVSTLEINWANGEKQKLDHLERPQLFLENGKPVALVCAADVKSPEGILSSFNVQIPILE